MIVEAASQLFLENGYHATSIGRIASQAGVAVQTIYNAVGSKRDLLSRVLDFAAAGERSPVPVAQFMREQAEREPDPRRIIAQLIEFWRGALPRTAPVFRIIREAAAADPEIAVARTWPLSAAATQLSSGRAAARRPRCPATRDDDRRRRSSDLRARSPRDLSRARPRGRLGRRCLGQLAPSDARGSASRYCVRLAPTSQRWRFVPASQPATVSRLISAPAWR